MDGAIEALQPLYFPLSDLGETYETISHYQKYRSGTIGSMTTSPKMRHEVAAL